MSKNFNKFLISIFAVSALVFGAFHNDASASFWDWFKLRGNSEQIQQVQETQQATAIANAATTYKWVNNGLVSESAGRNTGTCGDRTLVKTYTCDSSNVGSKVYDGTDRGSSYGDTGHAWPVYEGENTSTATEYTYNSDSCGLAKRTGGTVNEWECKSSDSTTSSSSSSSSTGGSSSSSSSSATSANHTGETGSATNITSTSATLNGTVNPKGENVYYIFAYIKESDVSSSNKNALSKYSPSGYKFAGRGSSDISLKANISGLSSDTIYNYRLFTYSSATKKFFNGEIKSFTTSQSETSSSSSSSSSSSEQYSLKVKISGAGKITSSGGSNVIDCKKTIDSNGKSETSGTCSIKLNKGESVTLSPLTPSTRYEFATWADDCTGAQKLSSCTIKMTRDKTVSATFNKKATSGEETATVSVRKTGNGSGKVISIKPTGGSMAGINCGNDCSENFKQYCDFEAEGNRRCGQVYFKAVPEKGSTFGGWSNCLTFRNEKDQCYVILDGDKTISANFSGGGESDLTVTVSAGGTVKSTDGRINCGSENTDCKESYKKNGTVTLKATPNSGYALSSTLGCDDKTNNNDGSYTCKVKMTQDREVKVNFKKSETSSSSSSSSSSSKSSSSSSIPWATNIKAVTDSASSVTSNSATLNGTVNPRGENVVYRFNYVKNGQSGTVKATSWTSAGTGSSDVSVKADISGLSSGTTYNFAIQAYSYTSKKFTLMGVSTSGVKSFTTLGGSSVSSSSSSSSSSSQTAASAWKLKVTVSGTGKVEDNYSKISCGSNMTCQATYSKGQVITLKTDDFDSEGKSFGTKVDSWSGGGCSGTGNACFVTMDGDKEITIKFVSK